MYSLAVSYICTMILDHPHSQVPLALSLEHPNRLPSHLHVLFHLSATPGVPLGLPHERGCGAILWWWHPSRKWLPLLQQPHLPTAPQVLRVEPASPSPSHAGTLTGLTLYKSCAGNHSCFKVMSAVARSHPEENVSHQSSPCLSFCTCHFPERIPLGLSRHSQSLILGTLASDESCGGCCPLQKKHLWLRWEHH